MSLARGWPEDRNTTHWLKNRGTIPAVEFSVDIVRQELDYYLEGKLVATASGRQPRTHARHPEESEESL